MMYCRNRILASAVFTGRGLLDCGHTFLVIFWALPPLAACGRVYMKISAYCSMPFCLRASTHLRGRESQGGQQSDVHTATILTELVIWVD